MYGIGFDILCKILTDGPIVSICGIGSTHDVTVTLDSVVTFQDLNDNGAGSHELDQIIKKSALLVHVIEPFGLGLGQIKAFLGDDPESGLLETSIDLTRQVAARGIRFDNRKRTFDSH